MAITYDAWGVTVSKASGGKISTYGIGYSKTIGVDNKGSILFGSSKGTSYYWAFPIGPNAKELYSLVESKV